MRFSMPWGRGRRDVSARGWRVLDEVVRPAVHPRRTPLEIAAWEVPGEPVPIGEALAATYRPVKLGYAWGPAWGTTWFRLSGRVPSDWAGSRVDVIVDLGFTGAGPGFQAEGLLLDADGHVIRGLHPRNHVVRLTPSALGTEQVDWFCEAAANPDVMGESMGNSPNSDILTARKLKQYRLRRAELAVRDDDVFALAQDLDLLLRFHDALPDGERGAMASVLTRALDALAAGAVASTAGAARSALKEAWRHRPDARHHVSAIGHAHIDTAWLWPIRETKRKASRTFANAVSLAEEYPELVFAAPQAQQFAWVKERHPDLFARIQAAVRAGTFVPVGGAWVEADGNLPGSESLARQLVHGKRFFREEFGVDTRGVWLPDSFGYTAAYPQLAVLAGNEWFVTQKLSWNDTNTFPHHTMWWEGLDGTRIFTHFPPADTYNGSMEPPELLKGARQFKEAGKATRSLYPFGYGDGGGGPTPEMVERARRSAALDGLPPVTIESPDAFFAKARAEFPDAPVWRGELYLELHRGTFTSQARGKMWNRRVEHLFREAELWAATASAEGFGRSDWLPRLDALWKRHLTLQFHDILPGSSIGWVHREAEIEWADIAAELGVLIAEAGQGDDMIVRNASPFARREPVLVADAVGFASQDVEGGRLVPVEVPALGAAQVSQATTLPPVHIAETEAGIVITSEALRVVIDGRGLLASVRAQGGRELLAGPANLLQLHRDVPRNWEAWDIDREYLAEHRDLIDTESIEIVERGPLRAAVRVVRRYKESSFVQTYRVTAGIPRVDVVTEIDWHERRTLLKAAFPLDLLAETERAETQYGYVTRPITENTSWDVARFERCHHRYLWVGENDQGAALLTDSVYGHDTARTVSDAGTPVTTVRLSLLRGPLAPDPKADLGAHTFTYSLCVGTPELAIEQAYALNLPLHVSTGSVVPPLVSLAGPDNGALIEAVKPADDGSGDLIVRLYESRGGRASRLLHCSKPVVTATICDLLEDPLPGLPDPLTANGIAVDLRPFQVLTLRLRLA